MKVLKKAFNRKQIIRQFDSSWSRLHRIARSWGCDDDLAGDLVQETCVIALDKAAQLRKPESAESWLITILANCHREHLRKAKRALAITDETTLLTEHTPEKELEHARISEKVQWAIRCLSDDHCKVLTLVDMEGFSYTEVAEILCIRVGTVMSRLSRARSRLRTLLSDVLQDRTTDEERLKGQVRKLR